ncbi:MAG: hypothetical protein ACMUJM_25615 [bacterium]
MVLKSKEDRVGPFRYILKQGEKPSEAVNAIFASGADTRLECNSMMVAIQYYAMLKELGPDDFDQLFAGGYNLVIEPVGKAPMPIPTVKVPIAHPLGSAGLYEQVLIGGVDDLLPGDWVYFRNLPDYITHNPGGLWSGEHAVYLGDKKFSGFGQTTQKKTEAQMNELLLQEYNSDAPVDVNTIEEAKERARNVGSSFGMDEVALRPITKEIK